jgi:hypothetical protein
MIKLPELAEQAKFIADWHGADWSSALCQDKDGNQGHEIICESREESVISTGSNSNESSWLCDYLEMCSPENIIAIDKYVAELEQRLNATAQPVSDGLVPVPDEFLYAYQNAKGMFELSEDCMCRLSVALSKQSKGLVLPPDSVVVPKVLTREMRHAWDSAPNANTDDDDLNMQRAYSAMLAAAPGGQDD